MQSRTPTEAEFSGWHKPEASDAQGNGCVEVGYAPGHAAVRDSKKPGLPAHIFTADRWSVFVDAVKADKYPKI
jgi:hypothetical protein